MVDGPIGWRRSVVRAFSEVHLGAGSPIRSVEVQRVQPDPLETRTEHLVHVRRASGELDVFVEPGSRLDVAWAAAEPTTAHQGVAAVVPVHFDSIRCLVNGRGVESHVSFVHPGLGERLEMRVDSNFSSANRPIFVPAPPQTMPATLRFLIADTFHLIRRGGHPPVRLGALELPTKLLGGPDTVAPVTATRVGGGLCVAGLAGDASDGVLHDGRATYLDGDHWFELSLDRAIPTPDAIGAEGDEGRFEVRSSIGVVATGRWSASGGPTPAFTLVSDGQHWWPGWHRPGRLGMARLRRRNRREESWVFEAKPSGQGGTWGPGTWRPTR